QLRVQPTQFGEELLRSFDETGYRLGVIVEVGRVSTQAVVACDFGSHGPWVWAPGDHASAATGPYHLRPHPPAGPVWPEPLPQPQVMPCGEQLHSDRQPVGTEPSNPSGPAWSLKGTGRALTVTLAAVSEAPARGWQNLTASQRRPAMSIPRSSFLRS